MKFISKVTIISCVCCYFGGLWFIASRFGLAKLLSRYGLSQAFNEIPKNFPQIKYLYIGLAIYTMLFVIVTYMIYRYTEQTSKEQDQLQQESSVVVSYAECMNVLLAQYDRSSIKDVAVKQKLQKLSRQIASLPPAVVRNATLKSEVVNIVSALKDLLSDNCTGGTFGAAVDNASDAINSVKRRSVTVKN